MEFSVAYFTAVDNKRGICVRKFRVWNTKVGWILSQEKLRLTWKPRQMKHPPGMDWQHFDGAPIRLFECADE